MSKHTAYVAGLAREQLSTLHHANGQPLVRLQVAPPSVSGFKLEDAGPIIAFSLLDPHGSLIGHKHVENLATLAGFQLRTGGLCNTGVLARVSGLDDGELEELYKSGRVCGDEQEFGGTSGDKPLGLVRISFGASSTVDDVHAFVIFLRNYFVISEGALTLSSLSTLSLSSSPFPSSPLLQSHVYLQTLMCCKFKSPSSNLSSTDTLPHILRPY